MPLKDHHWSRGLVRSRELKLKWASGFSNKCFYKNAAYLRLSVWVCLFSSQDHEDFLDPVCFPRLVDSGSDDGYPGSVPGDGDDKQEE